MAGSLEILSHPWFKGFDWLKLIDKNLIPPFKPLSTDKDFLSNFDPSFTK